MESKIPSSRSCNQALELDDSQKTSLLRSRNIRADLLQPKDWAACCGEGHLSAAALKALQEDTAPPGEEIGRPRVLRDRVVKSSKIQ